MAILRNTTAITATFEGAVTVTNSVPRGTALSATLSVLDSVGAAADLSDFTALTLEVRPYSTSSVALVQETLASGSFTAAPTLPAVHATFELADVETNIALGDVASSDLHLVIHGIASAGKVTIATGTITWTEDGAGTGDTPAANPAVYYTAAETDAAISSAPGGATPEGTSILSTGVTDGYVLTADGAGAAAWEASAGGGAGDAWGDVVDADIVPDADGTRDLGATATRFAETYTDALDVTNNITVGGTVDGRDIATDGTKLDGIEAGADVTDATNVTAAGALMDSEVTNLAAVKAFSGADYATAAQGATADSALQINPALGTPVSGVATNLTGTAAGLTAGTVTTNANLTGHITSVGNAAVLGSFTSAQLAAALTNETGTGAAVFATSPTLVTPALGTPSSGVATNLTSLNASQLTSGTIPAARIGAATIDAMTEVASGIKSGAGTGTKIITGNGTQTSGEVGVFTAGGLLASSGVVAANLYRSGGTDVAVADGGTGSSTAAGAATNLGLGTADSPRFTGIELGHATDTTLTRSEAGVLAVEGKPVPFVQRYQSIYIDAGAMVARTTAGAATDSTEAATNDVMVDSFLFDSITEEGVQFKLTMPDDWDLGTIKAKFYWDVDSGGTGTGVTWGIAAAAKSNDDAIDAAFASSVDTDDTVIAVGDVHVTAASDAVTVGGTPALGDLVWFEVKRVVGDANDDRTADAKLLGVAIQYRTLTTEPAAW